MIPYIGGCSCSSKQCGIFLFGNWLYLAIADLIGILRDEMHKNFAQLFKENVLQMDFNQALFANESQIETNRYEN